MILKKILISHLPVTPHLPQKIIIKNSILSFFFLGAVFSVCMLYSAYKMQVSTNVRGRLEMLGCTECILVFF